MEASKPTPRDLVRETRSNRITVPVTMVTWKTPLIYEVVEVKREGSEITIRLKVLKEGEGA